MSESFLTRWERVIKSIGRGNEMSDEPNLPEGWGSLANNSRRLSDQETINDLARQRDALRTALAQSEAEKAEKQAKLIDQDQENSTLALANRALRAELAAAKRELNSAEDARNDAENRLLKALGDKDALRAELAAVRHALLAGWMK